MRIPINRIQEAILEYQGWCTSCRNFTNYNVEPDAENYECEICSQNTVMGAENAIIQRLFE